MAMWWKRDTSVTRFCRPISRLQSPRQTAGLIIPRASRNSLPSPPLFMSEKVKAICCEDCNHLEEVFVVDAYKCPTCGNVYFDEQPANDYCA